MLTQNLSNEDRRLIISLGQRSKSPHRPGPHGRDSTSRPKTPSKENIPRIDLRKLQQSSGKKVLSPLRERVVN